MLSAVQGSSALPEPAPLEFAQMQGILISGYGHLSHSQYLFLHIESPVKAKAWLRSLLENNRITLAARSRHPNQGEILPATALNLAFTCHGIQSLGGSSDLLESFAPEFIEGMSNPNRVRQLGDFGINAPEHWEDPWHPSSTPVDVLVILEAAADAIEDLSASVQAELEAAGLQLLAQESGYLPPDSKEHFGFHDSISQPIIEGSPQASKLTRINSSQDVIKAGEFILGYLNEDGNYPLTPTVPVAQDPHHCLPIVSETSFKDFGRNGSYFVYRKMAQDVAGFRRYFHEQYLDAAERDLMMAKTVGRWPSGAPLTLAPDQDPLANGSPTDDWLQDSNNFLYGPEDAQGMRCPFGAHIRRTHPRDSLLPDPADSLVSSRRRRLLRRGVLYGDPLPPGELHDDGHSRGLLFFCLNANIRRQFEFVQQSWVNAPTFNGLYNERDPLIGMMPDGSDLRMVIPKTPLCAQLNLPNFVTLKGGAYFFLPSLCALRFLATLDT